MKSISLQIDKDSLADNLDKIHSAEPDIILIFSSKDILEKSSVVKDLRAKCPDARLIGCSTAGEIGDRVEDDTLSIMTLKFDHTRFEFATFELLDDKDSHKVGTEVGKKLAGDDLAGIFVLSPGMYVNGSELVDGIKSVLPHNIAVTGGLAGDGTDFGTTCTILDDHISANNVVAFALYGDKISIGSGSRGGWKTFGPNRRVTKAEKNVLYELDGKPALDLYKQYLGDKANDLPASGLLYPFAILDDDDRTKSGLVRTILNVNEEDKSLLLAGNLETGSIVSLMHASTDELLDGAEEAAKAASKDGKSDSSAVICVSCVGRKILMGDDTEEELEVVRNVIKNASAIAGFYSYGEICPFEGTGRSELHNQTMTITYIEEHAA